MISRFRARPSLDPIELSGFDGDEPPAGTAAAHALPSTRSGSVQQTGYRLALILIGLLAVGVIVAIPLALRSIASTWFGEQQPILYDLVANAPVAPVVTGPAAPDRSDFTLAIVNLDPMTSEATLAVSGNRICTTNCPQFDVTFFALDDNATERRGFPPSASLTILPTDRIFSEAVTLPVRGQPSLYPFDTYDLWLGFAIIVTGPGGQTISINRDLVQSRSRVTLQNQVPTLNMDPPREIDPASVAEPSDPYRLPVVVGLHFARPDYMKILAVVLIALIAVSGAMGLAMRAIDDLVLSIGGIILGVWGIRTILINQPLPGVSAIDVALSFVILFLLLGLMLRVIRYLYQRTNWSWPFREHHRSG
jgi:hypothetical protein